MTATLLWIASTMAGFGDIEPPRLIEFGGNPATGWLVNVGVEGKAVDPRLPTLVFIHGLNVAPNLIHFGMAHRLGEAIGRRGGSPVNVLGWDWNASTMVGWNRQANRSEAVQQGERLALALLGIGIDPGKTHLIGQSSGAIVAASAASRLCLVSGRRVARVSLLDPARAYHDLVFETYDITRSAVVSENAFAPGPSGFGAPVWREGLRNIQVDAPRPWSGVIDPRHSAHLHVVRWYLGTAADPSQPGGFNASVFRGGG